MLLAMTLFDDFQRWFRIVLVLIALAGISVGALSAVSPERSIGLYQWIMKWFNWRVEPIDFKKEIRNTRVLGILMVILSAAIFFVLLQS